MINSPFTDEQVQRLNEYQNQGVFHPFTCGNMSCREILAATNNGWVCPKCDYTQNWAHEFMLEKHATIFDMISEKIENPLVDNLEGDTDDVDEDE